MSEEKMSEERPFKLYIFDADGTLRRTTVPGQLCPNRAGEWELIPGVRQRLGEIDWTRARFGIASNQGGVGLGYLSYATARALLEEMVREAFALEDVPAGAVELCAHAPYLKCACRKPNPGMLLRLMRRFGVRPDETLYVGDMEKDAEAASAAGVSFSWAADFFNFTGDETSTQEKSRT